MRVPWVYFVFFLPCLDAIDWSRRYLGEALNTFGVARQFLLPLFAPPRSPFPLECGPTVHCFRPGSFVFWNLAEEEVSRFVTS